MLVLTTTNTTKYMICSADYNKIWLLHNMLVANSAKENCLLKYLSAILFISVSI